MACPHFLWEVIEIGSGNWIVDNLNSALGTWNSKLSEIWQLLSTSPEEFKGGGVWDVIVKISTAPSRRWATPCWCCFL